MKTIIRIFLGLGSMLLITGCAQRFQGEQAPTQKNIGALGKMGGEVRRLERSQTAFSVVGPTYAQTRSHRLPLQTIAQLNAKIPAEIQGEVFDDKNGNGLRDQDEPGIPHIRIILPGNGVSQISDEQGEFNFNTLLPGQQAVSIDELTIPQGYHLTTETTIPLVLGEGDRGYAEFGIRAEK